MSESIPKKETVTIWMCSCGAYWRFSKLDAEAHARLEGHELTEIEVPRNEVEPSDY